MPVRIRGRLRGPFRRQATHIFFLGRDYAPSRSRSGAVATRPVAGGAGPGPPLFGRLSRIRRAGTRPEASQRPAPPACAIAPRWARWALSGCVRRTSPSRSSVKSRLDFPQSGYNVHRLSRDVTQLLLHQASLPAREIEEAAVWMGRTIARCAPGGTMSAPGGRRHTGAKQWGCF